MGFRGVSGDGERLSGRGERTEQQALSTALSLGRGDGAWKLSYSEDAWGMTVSVCSTETKGVV